MAPKKRTINTNYPKYVNVNSGKYIVYRPRIPADKRNLIPTDKGGFLKPPVKLGTVGQPEELILRKYLAAKAELEHQGEPDRNSLNWVSKQYQSSRQFNALAPTTQKHYRGLKILGQPITRNLTDATLGDLLASEITKPLMQVIMDKRLTAQQERGNKGQAVVNYEARYISSILAWACNFIPDLGITQNPLKGLKRPSEPKNERYVTDIEYKTQYELTSGYLRPFFEIAYLCAARKGEVRDLRLSDVLGEGLKIRRGKGSKTNIVSWEPRLLAAVDAAKRLRSQAKIVTAGANQPLLVNANGEKITDEGIKSAMSRLKKTMAEKGLQTQFWALHMLKHKGMTDADNKDLGGHKSQSMKDNYIHELEVVKPAKTKTLDP